MAVLLKAVIHAHGIMYMNCKSCNSLRLCYSSELKISQHADKNTSETKTAGWQDFHSTHQIQFLPVSIYSVQKHRETKNI